MTCPKCANEMQQQVRGGVTIAQCTSCEGLFLDRVDLGELVEQENDWHAGRGHRTQPLPRITPDMAAPPASSWSPPARSYIDVLFR
ncbi:MAG: zf-TFIIB domain-containing protein [Nocardioidaceae bacterium]